MTPLGKRTFAAASLAILANVAVLSAFTEEQEAPQNPFALTATPAASASSAYEYEIVTPAKAYDLSAGRLILIKGENIEGLEGVERSLKKYGVPTSIVEPDRSTNMPAPQPDEVFAIANKRFGGKYTQDDIAGGELGNLVIFARNSGVPIQTADNNN